MTIQSAHISLVFIGVIAACMMQTVGNAQTCTSYHAKFGTLPSEQCWEQAGNFEDADEPYVKDGILHHSTLRFTNSSCGSPDQTQSSYWRDFLPINYNEGVVFEMEAKVVDSQYGINPCNDWPRPGFAVSIFDHESNLVWLGIGSSTVFLTTEAFVPFGSPEIVEADFDTTDDFHTYQLEIDGSNVTLSIDGEEILSLSDPTPKDAHSNVIWVGDHTSWANSEVEIKSFSLHSPICCPGNLNADNIVDTIDLLALLAAWGDADECEPANLNGDDVVDTIDLLSLLGAWGECP